LRLRFAALVAAVFVSGCTTLPPSGPSIAVLPGSTKSFEQFRADDFECRQYASSQTGISPEEAQVDSGLKSAVIGTTIGAVAGALVGGRDGAAVGAGAGLIVGSASGAGAANVSAYTAQRRYDIGYQQCMYAKGHRVPVSGRFETQRPYYGPPPGTPPPPPPR
jgi:YmgG-like glycine-zipper protein